MTGRWMSAREAAKRNERLFCGLPRDFANELLKSEVNRLTQRPIGLVLVSSKVERPLSGKWRSLVNREKVSDATESQFAAGVNAAATAVEGSVNRATGRFVRAKDKQTVRNIDLKREGLIGDSTVPEPAVWQSMAEGEHVPLPMRVSGLFW